MVGIGAPIVAPGSITPYQSAGTSDCLKARDDRVALDTFMVGAILSLAGAKGSRGDLMEVIGSGFESAGGLRFVGAIPGERRPNR